MKRVIATLAATLAAAAVSAGTAFAGAPVQSTTQESSTDQGAIAASDAVQVDPSNQNLSVRVLSPGTDGPVTQTNSDASSATAANLASTTQSAGQTQTPSCGCTTSPTTTSPVGMAQAAENGDLNGVVSGAGQLTPGDPPSTAAPASGSPSGQSNAAASSGTAANAATAPQTSTQSQPAGVQSSNQSADTDQHAVAASSATQVDPTNQNVSVRVLSPGNDGPVTQSNTAASSAFAGNKAGTTQTDQQTQAGSGVQAATQNADTDQKSAALSEAKQIEPSNSNVSVRVLSPGDNGSVTQSNNALSSAFAGNKADTTQNATQNQGASCGCGSTGGVQFSGQSSNTDQGAFTASKAIQIAPSNDSESVRIGSWGDGGNVTQTNTAASSAFAGNKADTTQNAPQTQSGSGVQASFQNADTDQKSAALSKAKQIEPSNSNSSVRVLSPGNDGSVTQSNNALSSAFAGNKADTTQNGTQNQGPSCGCSGTSVQALGQKSDTDQAALAASKAIQLGAGNDNEPVRIGSWGGGGSVNQSNNAQSSAAALNFAATDQSGNQMQPGTRCGCTFGPAVQALGQKSDTDQAAAGLSAAVQIGAENRNDPIRIWSPGNDGNVTQSNTAASSAFGGNFALTHQQGNQTQSGNGVQALGQDAHTSQFGLAASAAIQLPGERSPCGCGPAFGFGNSSEPVRIWSPGDDGTLMQSNTAQSRADALNGAATLQSGQQTQAAPCGCAGLGVQALGQLASTHQGAIGLSKALQVAPTNSSKPVWVWSLGGGGATWQSNLAASSGKAASLAPTLQHGTQLMV
jgi:hypothetical protein